MHTVANTEIQIHRCIEDPYLNHGILRYGGRWKGHVISPNPHYRHRQDAVVNWKKDTVIQKNSKNCVHSKKQKFKIQKYKDTNLL